MARDRGGAAVGELGPGRVVGAELQEAGSVAAIDPAVADVEDEAGRGQDDDAREGRAHAVQARPRPHRLEQLALASCSRPASAVSSTARAACSTRHSATTRLATSPAACPPMPSATRASTGRASSSASLRSKRSGAAMGALRTQVAERDRVLIGGAQRALMGERVALSRTSVMMPAAVPAPAPAPRDLADRAAAEPGPERRPQARAGASPVSGIAPTPRRWAGDSVTISRPPVGDLPALAVAPRGSSTLGV